jgi:ATP-dependent Clp protease ATP-binding subunit ClpB
VVDFRNSIIIMTSNIGSELILEAESMNAVRAEIDTLLKLHFKPEFLNRIDEIVLFERLTETMISAIAELRLKELAGRLRERDIAIEVLPEAKAFIASEGYDRRFGARPLKRAIQSLLENPLSKSILSGELTEGDSVRVGKAGEELSFLVRHNAER